MALTDFLLQRIAEDEAEARATLEGFSCFECGGLSSGVVLDYDPARVRAECEAKRRIVEMHAGNFDAVMDEDDRSYCEACVDPARNWDRAPHPCPTLRHLAAVYADHPDYRDEWRP